jgi:hypothetical protein
MTTELNALYHLHRHQVILNAKDRDGHYQFPKDYLYAVANRVFPFFQQGWAGENDPYLECYDVQKDFIEEVLTHMDELWLKKAPIPTFYALEKKYGREHRHDLILIFRYSFLHGGFDTDFYASLLKPTEHPTEASPLCRDFSDSDLMLL